MAGIILDPTPEDFATLEGAERWRQSIVQMIESGAGRTPVGKADLQAGLEMADVLIAAHRQRAETQE